MHRPLALLIAVILPALMGQSARGHALRRLAPAGQNAVFVVTGHGWGHGVGMSQYGAYGYAQHGFPYAKIVAHYFPGTTLGPAPATKVRVLLANGKSTLKLSSADDFRVKGSDGTAHTVTAGTYTFTPKLKVKVDNAATAKPLTGPLVFQPGPSPLQLGSRHYRGAIQVDVVAGKLRAIDIVGLEQYLYGVVPSEMPFDWAPEALKAQAVVARSYALASLRSGAFELYPDTRDQMYLGVDHEKPSTTAAVDATAGKVVLYNGKVAKTYFFSTSGGRTASAQDIWGADVPYLVSVPDPYDTISPYHNWGPVTFDGGKLARALHIPGPVQDVQTALNSSGRVMSMTVSTPPGPRTFDGIPLRRLLGLRSTWFSVGVLALAAPSTPVTYGTSSRLTGIGRGVGPLTLQSRTATTWQPVGTLTPAADGALNIAIRPTVTTDYRVVSGKITGTAAHVPVAPFVQLAPTQTPTELRGSMRPVVEGAPVSIQRLDGTNWVVVARALTDASGAFDVQLQLTTGTYRARVVPGHGLVPGVSAVLQVTTA
jgi:stage II sporulation protein D